MKFISAARRVKSLYGKSTSGVCKRSSGAPDPNMVKDKQIKKKKMEKGFLKSKIGPDFDMNPNMARAKGEELLYCQPCMPDQEIVNESKDLPFHRDGALVIETIPGASYTDMEFTMLNHVKEMVKSIQKGDLNSTGMVANHFLSGKFKQLCDKSCFQSQLFPGFSADTLESLPQNMRELLLWTNLTIDLTKIARNAAKVLTTVQQKGAARGDMMDNQTQAILVPQIAQEALAVELETAVHKLGKQISQVAARVQLSIADPEAEQASWDQLDEDVFRELSGPSQLCYQEEFLGEEWAALIATDCDRFSR